MDDELLDHLLGVTSKYKKDVLKEDPNTFEKVCHFDERC